MMDLFVDNWFKYGYNDDRTKIKRTSSSDIFFVDFEQYSIKYVLPSREAFTYNNLKIQEHASGSEIFVMLSGGYDSQAIAKTMAEDNIPFTALIFDFGNNTNEFDVLLAKKLCNDYNIHYKIISFDLINFYKSGEYKEYADATHCNYQYNLAYMRGLRDVTGVVVGGHGDQEIRFKNSIKYWQFNEQNYCLLSYAKHIKLDGYIRYYEFTKEMWYSIYENCWKNLKLSGEKENYKIKNKFFTDLGLTERPKMTGFELYGTDVFQPTRYKINNFLLNLYPSSQNDVDNLFTGLPTGDLVLIKIPEY